MNAPTRTWTNRGWPSPDPDVICQRLGNTMVLLHLRTDRFYELNSTAARVWDLLSQQLDRESIEKVLTNEFEVEPDKLDAGVAALLNALWNEGLIVDAAGQQTQGER